MTHVANFAGRTRRPMGTRVFAIATALLSAFATVTDAEAAGPVVFAAILSGQGQLPPVGATGSAVARFEFDPSLTTATVTLDYKGLATPMTGFALYVAGTAQPGPLLLDISPRNCALPSPASRVLICRLDRNTLFPPNGSVAALAALMDADAVFAEVTTAGLPNGALGGVVLSATEVHFAGCDTATMGGTSVHMAGCTTASF